VQRAGFERRVKIFQKYAAEEAREDADREKESRSACDPPAAIGRQAAGWDDAVEVGMMDERLSPRVEHGEEADLGTEMLRIDGNGAEGLGGRAKEDSPAVIPAAASDRRVRKARFRLPGSISPQRAASMTR
jgi:hypothetical protein